MHNKECCYNIHKYFLAQSLLLFIASLHDSNRTLAK